jgi:hypothetical protein
MCKLAAKKSPLGNGNRWVHIFVFEKVTDVSQCIFVFEKVIAERGNQTKCRDVLLFGFEAGGTSISVA